LFSLPSPRPGLFLQFIYNFTPHLGSSVFKFDFPINLNLLSLNQEELLMPK
jgi:hypothetical protein